MTFAGRIATLTLALAAAALFAAPAAIAQTNGTPAAAPAAAPAPPGDAAKGKAAFMSFGCYECHGTLGQGNFTTAPRLAPSPLPYAGIVAYIRAPRGNMPAFSAAILPDSVVADIYAYLKSIPAGKPASAIPLLTGTTLKPK